MGVDKSQYDPCAQKSMADLAAANGAKTLVGDLYTMFPTPPAITAAVRQVASKQFNTPEMSSDDAINALADAVDLAK
jgi:glucose/mannose transport system substrate-binding protein